jgi:hypothetical protein
LVQRLLSGKRLQGLGAALLLGSAVLLWAPHAGAEKAKSHTAAPEMWEMSLDGGRKLTWERNFHSESEVKVDRGFWHKVVDVIAGAPTYRSLVRPYSIATDSHGRILVTDPGAPGVHVFDFAAHQYKFIQRTGKDISMLTPQCVAVDAQDNIYVTDSDAGVIFVFEPSGKFLHDWRPEGRGGLFQEAHGNRRRLSGAADLCDGHAAGQSVHARHAGHDSAELRHDR